MPAPKAVPQAASKRKLLYGLLGDLPPRKRRIGARRLREEERESYVLERWVLDLNGIEPVPAVFARPKARPTGAKRGPAILFNHSHGGDYRGGKNELINEKAVFQSPHYAEELARRGIASLCIDQWNFGERYRQPESELFKETLWKGQVLWGLMVYDNLRALDYLLARRDVDASRVGTLGLSMGSTMAWWTAALDERVKVTVDLCCMTDWHTLIDTRGLDGHGIYYYVPKLLKHFDTSSLNALIAPRAHLSCNGNHDRLTPPEGLDIIDRDLKRIYRACRAPAGRWKMVRRNTGHFETLEMREEILKFIDRWL